MAIYITGSLAFDRIMRFSGKFADSILPDQIATLSVSFLIDQFEEKLGGNGGNIAYSLHLLGEKPIIVASAGKDFGPYRETIQEWGLPLEGIAEYDNEMTAGCYITTDSVNCQITTFHAAALLVPSQYTFPHLQAGDIGIICPSNPNDMVVHPQLYKKQGIRYIYDPSQQLPVLNADDVLSATHGCFLLMGNEYEISLIMAKTNKTKAELLAMTTMGIVTTMGEKGSLILHKDGSETHVPAAPLTQLRDPTGAGDAYRAGFLKALLTEKSLAEAAQYGTICAAYCVESEGTQGHFFTFDAFLQRYLATFGTTV